MQGWISLHREILDNPIVCKDTDYFTVWVFLLLEATHTNQPKMFKGSKIILQRGQLITGRKTIASRFNISESKVQRILKRFETEQQIEQQTSNKNRLVTVVKYNDYQDNEQQIEQSVNNKRTTSEQPVNTNNKDNNLNKDNKDNKEEPLSSKQDSIPFKEIIEYLNKKINGGYKHTTKKTKGDITARWNEGFELEDFKIVIDVKSEEWLKDKKMSKYLRPITLFSNKFESYLNQTNGETDQEKEQKIIDKATEDRFSV